MKHAAETLNFGPLLCLSFTKYLEMLHTTLDGLEVENDYLGTT